MQTVCACVYKCIRVCVWLKYRRRVIHIIRKCIESNLHMSDLDQTSQSKKPRAKPANPSTSKDSARVYAIACFRRNWTDSKHSIIREIQICTEIATGYEQQRCCYF